MDAGHGSACQGFRFALNEEYVVVILKHEITFASSYPGHIINRVFQRRSQASFSEHVLRQEFCSITPQLGQRIVLSDLFECREDRFEERGPKD